MLAYGFAYEDGRRYETGWFRGRAGVLAMTTGGTAQRFSPGGAYGSIEQVLWPTQHCMVDYLGLATAEPFVAYAAPRMDEATRHDYLEAWSQRVLALEGLVDPTARAAADVRGSSTSWSSPS